MNDSAPPPEEDKPKRGRKPKGEPRQSKKGGSATVSSRAKMRRCLKCQQMFMSDGPGNRLCGCQPHSGIEPAIWHR